MAISTKILAAGWTMSSRERIVAPSFVISVPLSEVIILSIPLGPKVFLTISAMEFTAFIFEIIYPLPWEVSVPSLNNKIVGCNI